MHDDPKDFMAGTHHPNRTQAMRVARGLKRTELADKMGCHTSQVFKLEKGDVPLTLDWLYRLAEALHCFPCELLQDWEDPMHRAELWLRLWELADERQREDFRAALQELDPDIYRKNPTPPQGREPLVEISYAPDGTYRAVVYPPDVPRKETRDFASAEKQRNKVKKVSREETDE